ncbi:MAG: DNA-3-methyladenine glycosylase 2 family protein [Lewinellaceae bacterium]|nr:DNA-3-methyladenine glycosylase 2 family protein [Saprospiraceae bacterium]MCB9315982.1 DNA-3-methyladenine glycosylase 2 family protein [Lewinellaceae bacterium]MCB9330089.1 DNA-3-methyladenine glycosylase 2 family protein [Lewinellaceae bacterium]
MDLESAILHLNKDSILKNIIQYAAVKPFTPSGNVYFDLLNSIVSQQLSVKAAETIFTRFCLLFPENYPSPELLLVTDPDQLRAAGLSRQKAAYLQNVAAYALENNIDSIEWEHYDDMEIIQMLTKIKGVGRWTVEMILMFTLGRPDVFPKDDLGIQQAIFRLYNLNTSGKDLLREMTEIAESWRPYRTVACRYLWYWKNQN